MDKHIRNLKEYIEKDEIYQNFKTGKARYDLSDFDKFCINHCEDIESLLEEVGGNEEMNLKFYYGSKNDFDKNDGVKLSNEEIQDMIDEVMSNLRKEGDNSYVATGDTIVFGFRCEGDDIDIYVCKNYELAQAWLDENGNFEKMDWLMLEDDEELEAEKDRYRELSKEELIDYIVRNPERPVYDPRREV